MTIPDNIEFQGADAGQLELAFTYAYENSPVFRARLDEYLLTSGTPYVVSYDNVLNATGVSEDAPGYHQIVDGVGYIRINRDVTATLITAGVPDTWTYYGGSELSPT